MPAARYWRAVGLEAHAGGDLELSELHVYDAGGRVDVGATLTSTIAPAAGALANLQDSDFGTTARFAAAALLAPAFALRWEFGAPVDVYGVRAAGPVVAEFLKSLTLQYSSDGVAWGEFAAELGDFIYPGADALTAAPTSAPWIYFSPGSWADRPGTGAPNWRWVAISDDGMTLAAGAFSNYVWTSNDSGATWVQQTALGARDWKTGAMSANGQKIIAMPAGGSNPWTSDNGGATWMQQSAAGIRSWGASAMSADGQTILASTPGNGGFLWASYDGGVTWAQKATSALWEAVGVSADGQQMIAATSQVQVSTDGGATWSAKIGAGALSWRGVAISANGQTLLAAPNAGVIKISRDGGATWETMDGLGARNWTATAMSDDGQTMVVATSDGSAPLYVSRDGGASWSGQGALGLGSFSLAGTVSVSSDGKKMAAAAFSKSIAAFVSRNPMFTDPPLRAIQAGTPEFFVSSPIPDFTTIKLPDGMPWRDMEFAGSGRVAGTVKEKNTPANTPLRRRVRLVREIDGLQIRETWSDASTGAYEFLQIDERHKYSVISYDYAANYRAVIADSLTPEIMT